jgi:hypothetical protein
VGKNFEIIFKEFHNSETFVMSRELLEDYKRQAAQAERERIIELLEDSFTYKDFALRDYLINEIKGENK